MAKLYICDGYNDSHSMLAQAVLTYVKKHIVNALTEYMFTLKPTSNLNHYTYATTVM